MCKLKYSYLCLHSYITVYELYRIKIGHSCNDDATVSVIRVLLLYYSILVITTSVETRVRIG